MTMPWDVICGLAEIRILTLGDFVSNTVTLFVR